MNNFGPPLWEDNQVISVFELIAVRNGFIFQYQRTPKYRFIQRLKFQIAVGIVNELLHWLGHGKPKIGGQIVNPH